MVNYYEYLQVSRKATAKEIKSAFRERAKQLHPDVAGDAAAAAMRKLLTAYETLSDQNRREAYDKVYDKFTGKNQFDYRTFLREQAEDPVSQAKLIFFELFHMEEDEALAIWEKQGGINYPMQDFMDREDWMDCSFIIAEELARRNRFYEAFVLLVRLFHEEKRKPYFRHFMEDVEAFLKRLIPLLDNSVDRETYIECLLATLDLGFPPSYKAKTLRLLAIAYVDVGDKARAEKSLQEALKLDPKLANIVQLKRKLRTR